jgi:hypothetical protein
MVARPTLIRVLVAAVVTVAVAVAGVVASGAFDTTPGAGDIPVGTNAFALVLAIALLVGFAAYSAVEWLQTKRVDSVGRLFDTRTIVLMALAIPINIVLGQIVASALRLPVYLDSIGTILVGVLAGPIPGALTGILSNLSWTFLLAGTPLGSPFAWPFAIVAAEIGLLAGLFGYAGIFRSRPNTPLPKLAAGIAVAVAFLAAIAWWGVLPYYRGLCPEGTAGGDATLAPLCFQLIAPADQADPVFRAVGAMALALVLIALVAVIVRLLRSRDLGVVVVLVAGVVCGIVSAFIATPIAALAFGGVTGSGTDLLVAMFQQAGSDLMDAVLQQSLISDPIDKAVAYLVAFVVLTAASRRVTARFPQGERALGTTEG